MSWSNDHLAYDWFHRDLPRNVEFGPNVYIESSYVFAAFFSEMRPALIMEEGSGAYDLSAIMTGPHGRISIGAYTCLNSTTLVCDQEISIGAHCLFAWGTVVTDDTVPNPREHERRLRALGEMAADPMRRLRPMSEPKPVTIRDNVWIGFDSVVTGGVEIGRGAIIGCKTLVTENIPPYAVVVGNPCRVLRFLEPDDTEEARAAALREFGMLPEAMRV
jgi:acetyltransferase-like isoleucine patch superfamily enzyme